MAYAEFQSDLGNIFSVLTILLFEPRCFKEEPSLKVYFYHHVIEKKLIRKECFEYVLLLLTLFHSLIWLALMDFDLLNCR